MAKGRDKRRRQQKKLIKKGIDPNARKKVKKREKAEKAARQDRS
jgi:hypothetical protein